MFFTRILSYSVREYKKINYSIFLGYIPPLLRSTGFSGGRRGVLVKGKK